MKASTPVSLLPLTLELHGAALQALYRATPGYWALYGLDGPSPNQAEHDLRSAAATPGRTLMGIVRRVQADIPDAGAELIGLIDFRQHWPGQSVAYVGLFLVAESLQRLGIGTQAWRLLESWLAQDAGMFKARLKVEQFNPGALRFFSRLGFRLTGQTDRYRVGDQFVRLLYMEQEWSHPYSNIVRQTGAGGSNAYPHG